MRDAKARKRVVEAQIADGSYGQVEYENKLFRELWAIISDIHVNTLAPATLEQYELSNRLRFEPFFGDLRLSEITPELVQVFANSLSDLSSSYAHSTFAHLRSTMNTAVDLGFLRKSPCSGVKLPKLRKSVPEILEPPETSLLIDCSSFPYRGLFAILAYTGSRISEGLALQLKHLNFVNKEIQIRQAWDTNCRRFGPLLNVN